MVIRIPWPEGTTPEEQRRRIEERDRQVQEWLEKRRLELADALTTRDIPKLGDLWHSRMQDACSSSYGPTHGDVDGLAQIALVLAAAAHMRGISHEGVLRMRAVFREMNGGHSYLRGAFRDSIELTKLRAAASREIDVLLIAVSTEVARNEAAAVSTPSRDEPPQRQARFRRSGSDHWDVFFEGTGRTVPHSKGMTYIRTLLANVGKPVHAWTLANNEPPPAESLEPVLDDQALALFRSAINQLVAERDASVDPVERLEVEERIADIRKRITADTRPSGKSRISRAVNSPTETNRNAVGKAMRKALGDIARECPLLGQHLQQHLHTPTGMQPMYSCPDEARPAWDLGEEYPDGTPRDHGTTG